ncbi:helix-turn-helix domain-containing protein [Streptomyces kebangsaanensis]|uniref:helix-turn-helix domain-containing protein n=1 Tax=Streptomyces kebangsaanensis TaxID=864058 RepID=UPI00093EC135|nr:helix-turn-helix transcriptional regulator [Streptomyces kebangsaanensis]
MAEQYPITRIAVARIRDIRKQRGITAEVLAKGMTEAGYRVDRTWIVKAENGGRAQISVDWLMAAAEALDVPASALLAKPNCTACCDAPPPGFACTTCGAKAART